ncbi:hypothetical protein CRUP_005262, partial [Coryphaenoides rupestris]
MEAEGGHVYQELRGVLVTLSSAGHLQCSYLGTDPSFFSTPKVDAREVDYEQLDAEMRTLQRYIREATRTQEGRWRRPAGDGVFSGRMRTAEPPARWVYRTTVAGLEPLGRGPSVGASTVVTFSAFLNGHYPPADLTGDIALSYSSPTELNPKGVPRVHQSRFDLPLALRYRVQSDSFEDMWLVVRELVQRFEDHFTQQGVKDHRHSFAGPLPLAEYFQTVDHHFQGVTGHNHSTESMSTHSMRRCPTHKILLHPAKEQSDAAQRGFGRAEREGEAEVGGWEESCDAAISHLLRSCLSRSPKEQAGAALAAQGAAPALGLPADTGRLKKHITLLCDRLGKGGRLTLASEDNTAPVPAEVQTLVRPDRIPEYQRNASVHNPSGGGPQDQPRAEDPG